MTEKWVAHLDKIMRVHTPSWHMAYILLTQDSNALLKFCQDSNDETGRELTEIA
jgi:hypothetical protein